MTEPRRGVSLPRKLAVLPLIAAAFFMISGGPYGTEDVVQKAGYAGALALFVIAALLWSAPTALMVAELSSALPEEGGFYQWVKRGLGPFWGFQEAWLSLVGSVFDMALYPALFVAYLGHFAPALAAGHWPTVLGLSVIVGCTVWNIFGARPVGVGSMVFAVALLGPFVVLAVLALAAHAPAEAPTSHLALVHADWLGGLLIAMWNLMGWDNPSTIAGEVENPRRAYPVVMAATLTLVVLIYLLPIAAVARTGISPNTWTTGGWVDLGRLFGGEALAAALVAGGVVSAIGTFSTLMLSMTRLPLVMAEDKFLPAIFARRHARTGVPWVAILACAVCWAAAFRLGFDTLAIMDILLTGLSVLLEFWALVALRVREPGLPRPFRVPGGMAGAIAAGIGPAALMVLALARNRTERAGPVNALALEALLVAAGVAAYVVSRAYQRRSLARAAAR